MGDLRVNPFIQSNYNYGNYERGPQSVGYNPFVAPAEGTPVAGVAGINGEITPTYDEQGSSYTTGLGHSKHTFMGMF